MAQTRCVKCGCWPSDRATVPCCEDYCPRRDGIKDRTTGAEIEARFDTGAEQFATELRALIREHMDCARRGLYNALRNALDDL